MEPLVSLCFIAVLLLIAALAAVMKRFNARVAEVEARRTSINAAPLVEVTVERNGLGVPVYDVAPYPRPAAGHLGSRVDVSL